ncbi:ABC transporter substrate-binding protein [Metabacillus arenae]|uniref:Extracellular solute-binding protein n=1 Tax=Metabacillus arenae TaxID=2771434 RepID=A0A926NKS6_9BACI|nr:extracellular solute-binding protein [Metabacillus arenae]MBD1379641.1 extracellular solute-binding protein [Metabacillus arenae]
MRKNLFRGASLFLILIIVGSLLSACSSKSSGTGENGEVTLKVLDWNGTNTKETEKMVKETVEKELPNVKLEFEYINWDTDFSSVMQTRIAGKQLPDIIMIKGGDHPKYTEHLMDLSSEEFMNEFPEDIRKALQIDGKDYAVPYTSNFQGVFYNKRIFAENNIEIPKTWDELMAVAESLQSKGITPFTSHFKDYQIGNSFNQFATIEVFSKNPTWGSDLQKGDVSFATSPEFKTVFKHFEDLYSYSNKDPFGLDFTGAAEMFAKEETAMWIIGTWSTAQVLKNNPDLEIGFFPTPAMDESNTKIIMQPDHTFSASATTKHPKEVKQVLEIFATNKEMAKKYIDLVQTESLLPDVVSEVEAPYVEDINTYKSLGAANANVGNVQIPWPYQEQSGSYIAEWLLGDKTLEEALKATDDYKTKVKFAKE